MTARTTQSATPRPPIIVVMGHVDHGKSTLLDYIRKSNTTAGEAGGITQHVAAYEVVHPTKESGEKRITFIDTPGHAAFKAIRARGANVADIAILVISAEEGIKEQTLEALASIRESGIPFVVAINKIDRPGADVERTKHALLEHEVYLEGLGGNVPFAAISAITGEGIPDLLDLILLVADLEELTGNPAEPAEGFVIETHRDTKRGIAATLIITNGSMKSGMAILAGDAIAPLRIMEDHTGNALREATFSTPVTIVGFDEMPLAGAPFRAQKNKKEAEKARDEAKRARAAAGVPDAETAGTSAADEVFLLPVVIKADAAGSLEAIVGECATIGDNFAKLNIIHSGVGPIGEGDVKAAIAAGYEQPLVIGFNVSVDGAAVDLAHQHHVLIEQFDIIYKLTERLAEVLKERTPKRTIEEVVGKAKIIRHFSTRKNLQVIGGKVLEGYLALGSEVRIIRRDVHIGTGEVVNLQALKQDVQQVDADREFGAQIAAAFEIAPGDIIECLVKREL